MSRRPRSLPGTPRASTPIRLRRNDSRERYFKDPLDVGGYPWCPPESGDHFHDRGYAYDNKSDGRQTRRVESGRYSSNGQDTFAVDDAAGGSTFMNSWEGKRGGSFSSRPPSGPSAPRFSTAAAGPISSGAGAIGESPTPHEPLSRHGGAGGTRTPPTEVAAAVGAGVPPLRTPAISGKGASASAGYRHSETLGKAPAQVDSRAASFVRLNSFLLRTHITSLVSALAEDGWLEAWEKDRLCDQARADSPAWTQAFFRSYMRFLETEDVPAFVASLRSQIV